MPDHVYIPLISIAVVVLHSSFQIENNIQIKLQSNH